MATAPLVFLDTETTGLHPIHDQIWEIAAIRREVDGTETEHHWFVDHNENLVVGLPEPFRSDHDRRYDARSALTSMQVVVEMGRLFDGGAHMVGAVPSFDAQRIERRMMLGGGALHRSPWHYHPVDVEAMAAGALGWEPPWDSDALSLAMGLHPPTPDVRHTAMGDARWARDLYDAARKFPYRIETA